MSHVKEILQKKISVNFSVVESSEVVWVGEKNFCFSHENCKKQIWFALIQKINGKLIWIWMYVGILTFPPSICKNKYKIHKIQSSKESPVQTINFHLDTMNCSQVVITITQYIFLYPDPKLAPQSGFTKVPSTRPLGQASTS